MARLGLAALVSFPCAVSAASINDVLDAARSVRASGCAGHAGNPAPLHREARLDEIARRWARQGTGQDLGAAFLAAGLRTRQSASLALLRTPSTQVRAVLERRLCAELTDAAFSQLGIHGDGDDVWLVLAEPSKPPAAANAERVAREVLELANAVRARGARCGRDAFGPAPPLRLEARLTLAARMHAEDMARHAFLAHQGRDGSTPARRVTRTGYAWRAVGENVAAGAESAAEVVAGWERSPEHCRNLMDAGFTEMGVAFAASPRTTGHSTWWSLVLARPR